jgi:glycosyltransferase involved in cell wall biosynthesis/thymidylate kinase
VATVPPAPEGRVPTAPQRVAGRVVVVVGADGSGKTRVAEQLLAIAQERGPVLHVHHRPGALPGGTRHDGPVTEPHREAPYPAVLSPLKLLYVFLDHRLGWTTRIEPVRRAGGIVVIERGWWDLAVDPRRYRLRPHPLLVRALGRLLPEADVTLVLDAPTEVLLARKTELPAAELERQRAAWRAVAARVSSVTTVDATRPVEEIVASALDDHHTVARSGWAALPSRAHPRWFVPRAPIRATRDALRIHRPVSRRAIAAWAVGHALAFVGAVRLSPRAAPDREVLDRLDGLVPPGGTLATSRSNHAGRSTALVMDSSGTSLALVKTSSDDAGAAQLAREAAAVESYGAQLPGRHLRAPRLYSVEPGRLVYEPITWHLDLRPWKLDPLVARELGAMHAAGRRPDGAGTGHGDVAPWNLLRARTGWYLVDWESAGPDHAPFGDLFHFLVQSNALLGRPRARTITEGLRGRGWIAACIQAYATAGRLDPDDAERWLVSYLRTSLEELDLTRDDGRRGHRARLRLLERLGDAARDSRLRAPDERDHVRHPSRDGPEDEVRDDSARPEVTVVISTYDRCEMLAVALCSALAQRDVDLEVIVVDNGSTDGTRDYLAEQCDPRLRVIRNEVSLGSVGGRNTGLAAARGEWVGMLDDDDLWAPDKLREQLDAAKLAGRDWVYAGCVHIDGNDRILSGHRPPAPEDAMRELPIRWVLPGGMSNVIWRRDRLDGDGLLDPELPFPADWDVCLRLARRGPPACVPRPLVGYRQHGRNMSRDARQFEQQLLRLERKRADMADWRRIDWAVHHRFVATEELRAGARVAAARAFARAVKAGDLGALPRAVGVVLPRATQRRLHHAILSDRDWIAEAGTWLEPAAGVR